MTWTELAERISKMSAKQKHQPVRLVKDLNGPDQAVSPLKLSRARREIWHGFGIGCELTFVRDDLFFEVGTEATANEPQ